MPVPNKKALLDEATAKIRAEELLNFVETEKPYLNPSISLRDLAGQTGIHPNQLSWLLNERIGQNFNEYINSFRGAQTVSFVAAIKK